jgi:hypothetical protein
VKRISLPPPVVTKPPAGTRRLAERRAGPAALVVLALAGAACGSATATSARSAHDAAARPALPHPTAKSGAASHQKTSAATTYRPPMPTAAQLAAWSAEGVACTAGATPSAAPYRGPVVGWTARLDGYTVTLNGTWTHSSDPSWMPVVASARLDLVDPAGRRSSVVLPSGVAGPYSPAQVAPAPSQSAMCLMRFPGSAAPAVVLGAGAQGLHDFVNIVAVPIGPAGLGKPSVDWAMADGWSTVFVDRAPLLSGDDGAFTYQPYSYFANHFDPPLLLSVQGDALVDVTRDHPALVTPDIASAWSMWVQAHGFLGAAALTAWVAVECVTGHEVTAATDLHDLAIAGEFDWPAYLHWPTGAAFAASIVRADTAAGYCTASPA